MTYTSSGLTVLGILHTQVNSPCIRIKSFTFSCSSALGHFKYSDSQKHQEEKGGNCPLPASTWMIQAAKKQDQTRVPIKSTFLSLPKSLKGFIPGSWIHFLFGASAAVLGSFMVWAAWGDAGSSFLPDLRLPRVKERTPDARGRYFPANLQLHKYVLSTCSVLHATKGVRKSEMIN